MNEAFEACSAFTHVSACVVARTPKATFTRVLQRIRCLLRRSDCSRPSDRLAGWDLHPLEIAVFSRRTAFLGRRRLCAPDSWGMWQRLFLAEVTGRG